MHHGLAGSSPCSNPGCDGDVYQSMPSSWSKDQVYTWVCEALNVGPKQWAFLKNIIEHWSVNGAKLLSLTREVSVALCIDNLKHA